VTDDVEEVGAPMKRPVWGWARLLGGASLLGVLVWRVGTGPFLDGLRAVDGRSVVAAAAITLATTVCSAWRWRLVASGLDVHLPLATAVAAYYRSQFLNCALPGGVVGDVHRGVRHGRDAGNVGRGLRAVAWERFAGQAVQLLVTLVVLLVVDSPVRSARPALLAGAAVGLLLVAIALAGARRGGRSGWTRAVRAVRADIHDGLLTRGAGWRVALASVAVVAGHAGTFVVAARTAGLDAAPAPLLPIALIVLTVSAIPLSIGGWGPREGAAAWAFGAAGFGAAQGVSTAVTFGVMTFVATLPGAIVLVAGWLRPALGRAGQVSTASS
jgi:glycosyltransferase 2 family protein